MATLNADLHSLQSKCVESDTVTRGNAVACAALKGEYERLQFSVHAVKEEMAEQGKTIAGDSKALRLLGDGRGVLPSLSVGGKSDFMKAMAEVKAKVKSLSAVDIVPSQRKDFFDRVQSIVDTFSHISAHDHVDLLYGATTEAFKLAAHMATRPATVAEFQSQVDDYFTFNVSRFFELMAANAFAPRKDEVPGKWIVRVYTDMFTQCRGVPPLKDIGS